MFDGWVVQWNEAKNSAIKAERNLSFEAVLGAIATGDVLDDLPHPNKERSASQRILVVRIDGYACAVPYIRDGNRVFFKTIYRNRKLQALYVSEGKDA